MTLAEVANQYIGKTETPNNSGFKDANFEKRMKEVGWLKGQAWCAYFAELCVIEWAKANKRSDIVKVATQIFSGSSTKTFKNADLYAKANPDGIVKVSAKPIPNSVAIYRYGNGWQGHTTICTSVDSIKSTTSNVEGNTNDVGGREGYIVARKTRKTNAPYTAKGLNIVGYIQFV
jgi:hypothetical protein